MTERTMPHNIDAEKGVLACLMIDHAAIDAVQGLLKPEDFYRDAHQIIYATISALHMRHIEADTINVCDELERTNQLQAAGGIVYISGLYQHEIHAGNIIHHADIVRRDSQMRRLIWAAGQIATFAWQQDSDAMQKAESLILSISSAGTAESAFTAMPEIMSDYMQELETLHAHNGSISGVPTGYTDLDHCLGGLQRGDLILLGGRPGSGKTSLGLCIAFNAALRGKKVAIFSLEMGRRQLARRLMAMASKVDLQRLRNGWIEDDEWEAVTQAMGSLSDLPIFINDATGNPISSMRSQLRRLIHQHGGIDLVIVDYLSLIAPEESGSKYGKSTVQEVSEISRGLTYMAHEFDIPVLALAQLSRAVESRAVKIPQLSDLRDSGSLEQDASVVLFVYRDDYYAQLEHRESQRPNTADIQIAKHRNGPVGEVCLYFESKLTMFYNLEENR